mgnify:CR=1 FL=1
MEKESKITTGLSKFKEFMIKLKKEQHNNEKSVRVQKFRGQTETRA